jgi:hypothetical protein
MKGMNTLKDRIRTVIITVVIGIGITSLIQLVKFHNVTWIHTSDLTFVFSLIFFIIAFLSSIQKPVNPEALHRVLFSFKRKEPKLTEEEQKYMDSQKQTPTDYQYWLWTGATFFLIALIIVISTLA